MKSIEEIKSISNLAIKFSKKTTSIDGNHHEKTSITFIVPCYPFNNR